MDDEQDGMETEALDLEEEEAGSEEATELFMEKVDYEDGRAESYYLAGRGARLVAQIIDGVALAAAIALGATNHPAMAVVLGLLFVIFQTYLLSTEGQTIGKSLMKIKIVEAHDQSNPGFFRAVFLRHVVTAFLGIIPFFSLANILFIFREDYRCIHDHLAGTIVIEDTEE